MPEIDLSRNIRARSVKLISYPLDFLMRWRATVKFLLHVAIFVFAYIGAYLLRFEFSISPVYSGIILHTIPLVLVSKAVAFLAGVFLIAVTGFLDDVYHSGRIAHTSTTGCWTSGYRTRSWSGSSTWARGRFGPRRSAGSPASG